MIDPATLATINALKTYCEKHVFSVLLLLGEPVPKQNIAGMLKIDRTY
jgi:hypothetical protein